MIKSISEIAEDEQYYTKSMANNVFKLTCTTPDTYSTLIKHFKEKGVHYHTYQLMGERAYRVVLKYLHHTTDVEDIRQELFALGHVVRNIVNFHHRLMKEPNLLAPEFYI
jgi:3-methyladenine DNA glycosylase AlkC